MSLAQFTFASEFAGGAAITTSSPIQGLASLDIVQNQVPAATIGKWILGYTAGLTKDCVDLKVLFQERLPGGWQALGLFVQLQGAIALASSAYTACIPTGTAGGTGNLVLNKTTISNAITDTGGLANTAVTRPTTTVTVAMGLRVERNPTSGNVLVSVSFDPGPISTPVASGYTFPGLVNQLTYVDVSSPYTTGTFGIIGTASAELVGTIHLLADTLTVDTD
jgi:hypothetical protein